MKSVRARTILGTETPHDRPDPIEAYAAMLAALGTGPRLRILRLLLSAHPDGLVVGEIQEQLGVPPSTLSHHLEKLKNVGLVRVHRESTYLRYRADAEALRAILGFLYAECCSRSKVVAPRSLTRQRR